jgi:tripartite-type tricarboxylate transporter receptor subunit TctC
MRFNFRSIARFAIGLLPLMALAALPAVSLAQNYPTKPIRLIVPFPPGGTTDIVARLVADKLSHQLGQPVVVDNRAGAGGSIGADLIAKAPADGYTLGIATVSTHAVNPAANPKITYNPLTDFIPITNLAAVPNVIEVHPSVPVKDLKEFIALLKKEPGKWSFATSGHAGIGHMMGEMFLNATGTDMVHVPYKGAGPAINDMLGGQVKVMFDNLPSSLAHIKAGKLVALAVAAPKRLEVLPNVPTLAELGLPEVNDQAWYGLVAPAKTPDAIVKKVYDATVAVLRTQEIKDKFALQGATPVGNTSAEYLAQIKVEFEKMKTIVKKKGITLSE